MDICNSCKLETPREEVYLALKVENGKLVPVLVCGMCAASHWVGHKLMHVSTRTVAQIEDNPVG